jgi:UDPglucose--hexose-1-phosphate uridylyltransferase
VNEVRVDPLTGLRTIIAPHRADRAQGSAVWTVTDDAQPIDADADPFAEGHEDRTPPEVHAVRPGGGAPDSPGWTVRVVPNRFPALTPEAEEPEPSSDPGLLAALPASGRHEVVINAPEPVTSLADLDPGQVATAMDVWRARTRAHVAAGAACVHVLVNERPEGGASLPHTHAQIYAMDFVPAQIARERERFTAHQTRTMGGNLLQDLVQEEVRRRDRLIAVDDEAVLLAPYASRLPFQMLLAPRRPLARFEDDGPLAARLLHDGLNRLRRALGFMPPLNLWVRTAPLGADVFCWRIDVLPRLTNVAGLELGTGVHLNIVAPEAAAAQLRDA